MYIYTAPSYNQPYLGLCPTWSNSGITFVSNSVLSGEPRRLFINTENSIYVSVDADQVLVWSEGSNTVNLNISNNVTGPFGIFVTIDGYIYIANSVPNRGVFIWSPNGTNSTKVMPNTKKCSALFIDINNTLYCSCDIENQVLKISLEPGSQNQTTAAGKKNVNGSTSDLLNSPIGIFVDRNLSLYVADSDNDRIQLFLWNELNGTTIAGTGASATINLKGPSDIVFDGDGYLYIVDTGRNRIVASGPNGFRCVIGCKVGMGSASYQLHGPFSLSFDTYGNIYVSDRSNYRIQKFIFINQSCDNTTPIDSTTTSNTDTVTVSTDGVTSISTSALVLSTSVAVTDATSTTTTTMNPSSSSETTTSSLIPTTLVTSFLPATVSNHVDTSTVQQGTSFASLFTPSVCASPTVMGPNCSLSTLSCDSLRPCYNNATCINNNTVLSGYTCNCLLGFNGTDCQYDYRPCQPDTCWNNGMCNQTSNTSFICICVNDWQGEHCQTKINHCENITCYNNGVCKTLSQNYTCQCIGDSYSGRHCERTLSKRALQQSISRSFAYVAIMAIAIVALFIIIMDVSTYVFGIDPVKSVRRELRRRPKYKTKKKEKRFITIQRPIYIA
ncbi:unnamed protein product [Adineta ricciae]|uniref:EGF-like domain-containing protein n=1 Tax=Adineta ricciae TaxID=249248 RepID=A0A814QG43_ADIRI|nr:unnamed protein product [Adineta ricciae]